MNGWNDALICSARRHDFVISRHEWFSGGGQLGPEGRQHVARIAAVLSQYPDNIIIEAEPTELRGEGTLDEALARTAGLNEQRRNDIVATLMNHGVRTLSSESYSLLSIESEFVASRHHVFTTSCFRADLGDAEVSEGVELEEADSVVVEAGLAEAGEGSSDG